MKVNQEVDLFEVFKTLFRERRFVIKTILLFMLIGLVVALISPKEYRATMILMPQQSGGQIKGGLKGIASLAGFNLGQNNSEELPILAYPLIAQSLPFRFQLGETPLKFSGYEEPISFTRYYRDFHKPNKLQVLKKYTIGLPGTLIAAVSGKAKEVDDSLSEWADDNTLSEFWKGGIISINKADSDILDKLREQTSVTVNQDEGYVTLASNMPNPIAAAQLTNQLQLQLQKAVTEFKVQKAQNELDFISSRFEEREKEFKAIQNKLAEFRDKNRNFSSAVAQVEIFQLESEYDLLLGVYTELAKQVESARIQVTQDTPVFSILEPVHIPTVKYAPKRLKIIVTWTFFGFVFGGILVFLRPHLFAKKEMVSLV
ncbi:MAG: hypothetical protein ACJAS3_000851 [Roseivirga sp.]|jgi:uncharacterized protein involved in exopolysaccharide biosynthesis